MYQLSNSHICFDDKLLCAQDAMLVDKDQTDIAKMVALGLVKKRLPAGDYVFHSGTHMIVVEEKRLHDLESSYKGRRLQHQLRKCRASNPDGLNVLALRASGSVPSLQEILWQDLPAEIVLELLKWQAVGGLLGFLPHHSDDVVVALRNWRAILKPGQHLYSVLAGSEQERMPERMTKVGYALRRLFKGVGPKTGRAWAEASGQSLTKALTMPTEDLTKAGVTRTVIEQRKELK